MRPETDVGLAYYGSLPADVVREFERELGEAGVAVEVHSIEDMPVFGGVEWLLPTIVTAIIAGAGTGFLQEAGADAYRGLRRAVVDLGGRVLGRGRIVRAGQTGGQSDYSVSFSIVVFLGDGWRLKVLLKDSYDAVQLGRLFDRLFEQLELLGQGEKAALFDDVSIPAAQGKTILAAFDEDQDALLLLNPFPRQGSPES